MTAQFNAYTVVSDSGIYINNSFFKIGSIVYLSDMMAKYLLINKQVAPGYVNYPNPIPPEVDIQPTESNTTIVITVHGSNENVTIAQLVDLFPSFKGVKGDKGDVGAPGKDATGGSTITVNGQSGPTIVLTKSDVGLDKVENIAPLNMPVSTATAKAISDAITQLLGSVGSGDADLSVSQLAVIVNQKAAKTDLDFHVHDTTNPHAVTSAQVGLGNVANLAPADLPVSTAQAAADALVASAAATYTDTAKAAAITAAATDATGKANAAQAAAIAAAATDASTKAAAAQSAATTAAATDATTKANAAQSAATTAAASDASSKASAAQAAAIAAAATDATAKANAAVTSATTAAATDASTKASTAQSNAISAAATDASTKAATAQSNAITAAASDATTKANTAQANAIAAAATDATTKAGNAQSAAISAAASDATTKANAAQAAAISAAAADATTKASTAQGNATSAAATDATTKANAAQAAAISAAASDASTKASAAQTAAVSAAATNVTNKLNVRARPIEDFGTPSTDFGASITTAAGTSLDFGGIYPANNITLSPGQMVRGRDGQGIIRYDQDVYAKPSTIRVKSGQTIRMKASSSLKDMTILPDSGFISPVSTLANARTNKANFTNAGTAITAGEGSNGFDATDAVVENTTILGFNLAVTIDGTDSALYAGRFDMRNVRIDCNNGVYINNVADVPRFDNVHIWPFTSYVPGAAPTGSTADIVQRSGYGFYVKGACDWMQLKNCFVYGHTYGFILDSCSNVQLINCQADNSGNSDLTTREIAFRIVNGTESARLVECFTVSHRVGVSLEIANYAYVNRPNLIVSGGQFVANERCFNIVRGNAVLDGIVCQAATYGVYIGANAGNVTAKFRAFGAASNDGARVGTLVYVEPGYAGVLNIEIEDGISDNCNTLFNIPDSVMRNGRVSIRGPVQWTTFTPSISIGGNAQSSGFTATTRWRMIDKTCFFTTAVVFNGTTPPTGVLQIGMPIGAKATTIFPGRRDGVGGQMIQAVVNGGSNTALAVLYDNSNPQAANATVTFSGSYETA